MVPRGFVSEHQILNVFFIVFLRVHFLRVEYCTLQFVFIVYSSQIHRVYWEIPGFKNLSFLSTEYTERFAANNLCSLLFKNFCKMKLLYFSFPGEIEGCSF